MSDLASPSDATHRTVWELLPWSVNGTLEPEETRMVESHLELCSACREEFDVQRRLGVSIADADDFDTAESHHWNALHQRIRQESHHATSPQAPAGPKAGDPQDSFLDWAKQYWHWPAIAVAACIALVAVTGQPGSDGDFRTLTAPASVEGPILRIKLADGVGSEALRALLEPLEMQILTGPSPTGVYAAGASGSQSLEDAAAALSGSDGIEFVTVRPGE